MKRENRKIIKLEDKEEALKLSREMFSRYIDKYRSQGLTEANAINWLDTNKCEHASLGGVIGFLSGTSQSAMVCKGAHTINNSFYDDLHAEASKHKDVGRYVLPDGITGIHELMHIEEMPKGTRDYSEILTVTRELINSDEIHKKINNIAMDEFVKYPGVLNLTHNSNTGKAICNTIIPVSKYINFYRDQEKTNLNLAKAITSPASIDFLTSCKSK